MKWVILMLAPVGALSSNNWIMVWVFLELSSFSFIIISKNKSSSESIMKYFLIQTISSIFILTSISLKMMTPMLSNSLALMLSSSLMITSLMVKSGLAPLHFWMPSVSKGLSWMSMKAFLTVQKVAPMLILINMTKIYQMTLIILMCSIIGTLSQMATLNFKILLTYSSIAHSGWMLLGSMSKTEVFIMYMLMYVMISLAIMIKFESYKMMHMTFMSMDTSMIILLLSLGGVPPLAGFFPKWLAISMAVENNYLKLTCVIMTLMACLNIYIYTRIMSKIFLKSPMKMMMKQNMNYKMMLIMLMNLMFTPFLLLFNT